MGCLIKGDATIELARLQKITSANIFTTLRMKDGGIVLVFKMTKIIHVFMRMSLKIPSGRNPNQKFQH